MFSFINPPTTEIYTLSLHDALPILSATPVVRHRSQIGTRPRGRERFFDTGRAEPARRVEIRVDDVTVILQHLSRGPAHRVPRLIRFHGNPEIDLIAGTRVGHEPESA